MKLISMMHTAGLHPTSFASDGAETECAVQRIVIASATAVDLYNINNAIPGCALALEIPLFNGKPTIAIQDSKHGAKPAHNQLFTGARILTVGNFPVYFQMLLDIVNHPSSPLFRRDVERVDKQDDRAAARLLSSETLDFILTYHSDRAGLLCYLFVLGELIDAWQHRALTPLERARMVLRARFFLMCWRSHIMQHPDHEVSVNFISRESFDIFVILCDSLLKLIIVHRLHYPTYPLTPWLHSTEPCEHIFGMLRQLKKDFNFADVLHLERKLSSLIQGDFQMLTSQEQERQTAEGYHHTYFHAPDLDMAALLTWPSDEELFLASKYAFAEAEQLLQTVGIDAREMIALYQPPPPPKTRGTPVVQPLRPQTLHDLLKFYAEMPLPSKVEDEVELYEMALASNDADRTLAMFVSSLFLPCQLT